MHALQLRLVSWRRIPSSYSSDTGEKQAVCEAHAVHEVRAVDAVQVLPRFVCYCDQDWYASVLQRCRVDGSDLALPFVCPLDILLNPGSLDASQLPYRMESYLHDARTAAGVVQSEERVQMHADDSWVERVRRRGTGGGGVLRVGASAEEAKEALVELEGVHVLRVEGLRPGGFGGWRAEGENVAFDQEFALAIGDEAKWCCTYGPEHTGCCH